jgi:hypothetical protein
MRSPTGQQQNRRTGAQSDRDPAQSQQQVPASSQAPQQISQIISVGINQRLKSILARAFIAKYFGRVFVRGSRVSALPRDVRKGSAFPALCSFYFGGYASSNSEAQPRKN